MSGELARRDDSDVPGVLMAGSLVAWAQEARDAHQIAESLARTSFVPRSMQGHPEEVTAAILTGRELGLEPMAALRSINLIEGTPALTAAGMRGLAQSHGHQVWTEESTDTRAVVCGRRHGAGPTERVVWSIDRAKKAGLAGKNNWTRHPAAMLVARATSEVVRRIASDVLMGMPYAAEEIGDGEGTAAPPVEAPEPVTSPAGKPKPRTLKRAAVTVPLPEPAADSPAVTAADSPADSGTDSGGSPPEPPPEPEPLPLPEPEPEPEPEQPDLMTEPQKRALMAVYRRVSGDRDQRIAHASAVLGRDITSFGDLTKLEAMTLLDALTTDDNGGGS